MANKTDHQILDAERGVHKWRETYQEFASERDEGVEKERGRGRIVNLNIQYLSHASKLTVHRVDFLKRNTYKIQYNTARGIIKVHNLHVAFSKRTRLFGPSKATRTHLNLGRSHAKAADSPWIGGTMVSNFQRLDLKHDAFNLAD